MAVGCSGAFSASSLCACRLRSACSPRRPWTWWRVPGDGSLWEQSGTGMNLPTRLWESLCGLQERWHRAGELCLQLTGEMALLRGHLQAPGSGAAGTSVWSSHVWDLNRDQWWDLYTNPVGMPVHTCPNINPLLSNHPRGKGKQTPFKALKLNHLNLTLTAPS